MAKKIRASKRLEQEPTQKHSSVNPDLLVAGTKARCAKCGCRFKRFTYGQKLCEVHRYQTHPELYRFYGKKFISTLQKHISKRDAEKGGKREKV